MIDLSYCNNNTVVTVFGGLGLLWEWDDDKNLVNKRKHGLSFETAQLVFDDPLAASHRDPNSDEERWYTIGMVHPTVILVVHTWPEAQGAGQGESGRIISARKATPHERRAYEEG